MLLTITLIFTILIASNFLLLVFSCNKTAKQLEAKKNKATRQLVSNQLAATGR